MFSWELDKCVNIKSQVFSMENCQAKCRPKKCHQIVMKMLVYNLLEAKRVYWSNIIYIKNFTLSIWHYYLALYEESQYKSAFLS
jgi:hypothetical protein